MLAVTIAAAVGAGLVGGVFFAFSTFVMPALARLPAPQGVAAMNAINVTVINRWFLGAFLGTAALCLALVAGDAASRGAPGWGLRLLGSALYLAGTIAVTFAYNVPLNDTLAAVAPESARVEAAWGRYVSEWCAWNHVRTAASVGAAVLLTMAAAR